MERIKALFEEEPELAEDFCQEGVAVNQLWDPCDVNYMMDQNPAKTDEQVHRLLKNHLNTIKSKEGSMVTQRTEHWGRYSLDGLIRLLWRMRDTDGEVTFMRGKAGINQSLILWKAEISNERDARVLRCYDEDRRNFMYMTLKADGYLLTRHAFEMELTEFLDFPEKSVWLGETITMGVLEVNE